MSTAHQSVIAHRRAVPEVWPQLIATLEEAAPDNLERATTEVWNRIGELGIDELDSNRYFAIGSALCRYARIMSPILGDPIRRQELVRNGAVLILAESPRVPPTMAIEPVLEVPMEVALAGRPESERIVGDCLAVHNLMRGPYSDASVFGTAYLRTHILGPLRAGSGESYLAEEMTSNVLGAVTVLDSLVSHAQTTRGEGYRISSLPTEQDIAMLRTPHTLMWLKRLASRVPLPYFQDVVNRNIVFGNDENGLQKLRDIDWDAEQKIMEQRKAQDPSIRKARAARLVCPAMHVTGMIDDNVALAIDMIDQARQISS